MTPDGLVLVEVAPGVEGRDVQRQTGAPLHLRASV
ncbi:hypothetical protein DES52_11963 [Deinococcus yavapaiensis KR-236]|uniref:Uncharacterized protein n=1 Tax=Deinococcus yavapaiensis KR-236 TaxID=694435 RepID=A0A318S4G9_9DEIO|nr:hypothetical protein DES52_11963 [Deinococcus yavapaiensis KR-236]